MLFLIYIQGGHAAAQTNEQPSNKAKSGHPPRSVPNKPSMDTSHLSEADELKVLSERAAANKEKYDRYGDEDGEALPRTPKTPAHRHAAGMKNTLKVYSDDHYMRVASTDLETGMKKMQNKLDRLATWAKKMFLPFTTTKGKSYFTVRCPAGREVDRSALSL